MYEVLTFETVQGRYWNKDTKKSKPIKYEAPQDYDGSYPLDFYETFIPDGNILVRRGNTQILWEDYLSYGRPPYAEGDSHPVFYYLTGKRRESPKSPYEAYNMQICSGPLNAISTDCMDATLCLVPASKSSKSRQSRR